MKTTLIVDGYNAINAIPEAREKLKEGLERARKTILIISKEYARRSGYITDICVVFDGDDKYRYLDAIDISRGKSYLFSPIGGGDDKIIDMVKQYSSKGKVVLASNDNYVRNNSRVYGASVISSEELYKRVKKPSRGGSPKKITRKMEKEITNEYKRHLGI